MLPGRRFRGLLEALSQRLDDERWLAKITIARLAREARSQIETLAAAGDSERFDELAMNLDAPRQRELIERIRPVVPAAAIWLEQARLAAGKGQPPPVHSAEDQNMISALNRIDPLERLPPGGIP